MSQPDGGPAFPGFESPAGGYAGMSLRDYFAGQALAGGADSFCDALGPHADATDTDESIAAHAARHAKAAFMLADAMLKERAK